MAAMRGRLQTCKQVHVSARFAAQGEIVDKRGGDMV
jgi:hypothetical protein